ncbi:NETI motif-containing protein [Radiobacillus kanasensis]|uniref:NETI motif-containing protein n=1 Tax=Radiobacillus kanasensis TaxID=2844358 RepID=UPI001E3633C2|nr:NETI motif-containing protein [Radiobacillus kanasensis]UFT99904.1 NETI motif-containing protein [Radiobacillus kanasensis]
MSKNKKKRYQMEKNETIEQCLERIKRDGYMPVRRTEQPVFQEKKENGETSYEPVGRIICFDAVPAENRTL